MNASPILRHFCLALLIFPVKVYATAQQQAGKPSVAETAALKQADAAFHSGVAALQQNDLKTARTQFENTVRLAPSIPEGHSALGFVLLQLGEPAAAVAELDRSLALKPDDPNTQITLGEAYSQTGQPERAIALFKPLDGNADSPLDPPARESYAKALAATGDLTSATAQLQRAVTAAPSATLHDELGSLFAQQQQWPAAESSFNQALALDANYAPAHLHLGVLFLANQRNPEALQQLQTAVTLDPGSLQASLQLALALIANNRDDEAIARLRTIVAATATPTDAGPSNFVAVEARYQLALALQNTGKMEESIPFFQQTITAQPENAAALTNLGLALVYTGKVKEAMPYYDRALKLNPGDPVLHQDRGVAYLQQSDLDDAIREFRAGLALAPDSPELHYNLGLALKLKDDPHAAIPELEKAVSLNPDGPDAHYTLGVLYMQAGNFASSESELRRFLTMRPDNGDAWATLGSVCKQANKLPEAVTALREAIRLSPAQPGPHITLAGVLALQGDAAGASAERKLAGSLTRTAVGRQTATFNTNSGKLLAQNGQLDDALSRFQAAIRADETYAPAHRELAALLEKQGKPAEAAAERAKADSLEKSQ